MSKVIGEKKTIGFILLLLVLGLSASREAVAQNFWQQTNGPNGGFVRAFAMKANGDIFAGTIGGGVLRSTNNGDAWTPVNNGLTDRYVQSLAINNSGHIFAGTELNGVFRSTDNGNSWALINIGLPDRTVRALAINAQGHIFSGTYSEGVFCSKDNGDSWMPCDTTTMKTLIPEVEALAINAAGNIFAGSYGSGVFRSTNNGKSWTRINSGLTDTEILSISINASGQIFVGTDGGGIFRSTNNGDFWTPVNNGLTNINVTSVAIRSGNIFAGTGAGVFRSTDNGNSWAKLAFGDYDVLALIINNSGHIFAGTDGLGIFRSTNNGDSWTRVNNGLTNTPILALALNKSGNIFAGSFGDPLFRSTDNGTVWTLVDSNLTDPEVGSLAINSQGIVFAGTLEGKIFRSRDNITSAWEKLSLRTTSVFAIVINASDVIFAGAGDDIFTGAKGDGIFRSTNNGNSWINILPNVDARSLAINKSGHIFAGIDSGGVFRSTDNGNSWTSIGLPNLSVMALAINDSGIFAGTLVEGVFRSTDGGNSWTAINKGLEKTDIRALAINKGGIIFAGASSKYIYTGTFGGGVFRSKDNGKNWTPVNSGLTNTSVLSLALNDSGYIFAGTFGGGVFRSIKSTTGTAPTAITTSATNVNSTSATINGVVNPNGLSTTVKFEYGTTTSYGNMITATPSPFSGTSAVPVSATLMNLTSNTTYHYRVVATNGAGTTTGSNRTFTTFIFTEIGASAGVADPGDGRGVAFGDIDNDGDQDICISIEETPILVYRNDGLGKFDKIGLFSGSNPGQGIAFADIDNDGDLDLYVARYDSHNRLYRNNGDGTFTNIAAAARVDTLVNSRGVAFGDVDNDGYLDLYVVNQNGANILYHNNRDGTFDNIAPKAGLNVSRDNPNFYDQGASFADIDNDGDLDLYVAGAGERDLLFRNNGNLTFKEIGNIANVDIDSEPSQGVAFGDIDNDSDLDLCVTNGPDYPNRLYQNDGTGIFTEKVVAEADTSFGSGVAFADVDNDGDLDFFIANEARKQDRLFLNNGKGVFIKVDTTAGIADADDGRGVAFGDIDNDGDLDLYVVNDGVNRLYKNEIKNLNKYLIIKTAGTTSNRDGIGARVRIVTGSLSQIREVNGGSGYLSQNSLPVQFGLGQATKVDSIIIRWPSGTKQILTNVATNQFLPVTEPANRPPVVINAIFNQTLTVGGAPFIRNLNAPPVVFSDPDGDVLTYSANSSDTTKAKATISGSTLTVAPVAVGSATITITANDGNGGTAATMFTATINGSAPVATTGAATNVSATSATLNGTVNPNGLSTAVKFQYGTTTSYGNEIAATPSSVSGTNAVSINAQLTGLSSNTTYHYRVVAANSADTTNGADQLFTTSNRPPVVANAISNQNLTIGGAAYVRNLNALPIVFNDPDGDALTYTANSSATNIATANVSGSTLTVTPIAAGSATIIVTANDGKGGMVSTMFGVTVTNPPSDVSGPQIIHTPIPLTTFGQSLAIAAMITDNTGVQSAVLFFRAGGSSGYDSTAMAKTSGDNYQAAIPSSFITASGIEYSISARDGAGNHATIPATNPRGRPLVVQVLLNNLTFTKPTPAKAYRMISIPFDLDDKSPLNVFGDDLGGVYNDKQWRLLRYANGVNVEFGTAGFANFTPGLGFWLITLESKLLDAGAGRSVTTAQNYIITLPAGWSQIGNPFAFTVNWSEVIKGANVESRLVGYQGSSNEQTGYDYTRTQLLPFEGYFVNNRGSTPTTIEIPPKAANGAAAKPAADWKSALQHSEWALQITAACDRYLDKDNYIGNLNDASDEWDANDFSEAPFFDQHVALYFPHPEWKKYPDLYTGDFRETKAEGDYWDFVVKSEVAKSEVARSEVVLKLAEVQNLPAEWEVILLDKASRVAINFSEKKQYSFPSGNGKTMREFRVVVGKKDFVETNDLNLSGVPQAFALGQNYPNPFSANGTFGSPSTRIDYELPATSRVKVSVYNLSGQLVRTLFDGEQNAGRYVASWDGANANGERVASGVYLVRMEARPATGSGQASTGFPKNPGQAGRGFVQVRKIILAR